MTVCTVLEVRPYSGYYPACPECMGKVVKRQERMCWCRKCCCVVSLNTVHQRYCISMTITDHSYSSHECAGVVLFGKSCDPIFGCSALVMKRYLSAHLHNMEATHLVHTALISTLVGRCFAFTFNIPLTKNYHPQKQLSLTSILQLTSKLRANTIGSCKGIELVATSMKILGGAGSQTVIDNLQLYLEDTKMLSSTCSTTDHRVALDQNVSVDTQQHTACSSDGSSFFDECASGVSSLHKASLLLESYSEDSQSLSQLPTTSYNTELSPTDSQQAHPMVSEDSQFRRLSFETIHLQQYIETQKSKEVHVCNDSAAAAVYVSDGSSEECCDYFTDLVRNNALLKELESDWESTQVKLQKSNFGVTGFPPVTSPSQEQCCYESFSEEMLKELQEPFSQSRETSPSCVVSNTQHGPLEHPLKMITDPTSTPTENTSDGGYALGLSSPDLFSSASSCASSLCKRRSNIRTEDQTPSQLLFDSRSSTCTSPELFGSSSKTHTQSLNPCLFQISSLSKTPALPARTRSHTRRKLVQDDNSGNQQNKNQTHLELPVSDCSTPYSHKFGSTKPDFLFTPSDNVFSPDLF